MVSFLELVDPVLVSSYLPVIYNWSLWLRRISMNTPFDQNIKPVSFQARLSSSYDNTFEGFQRLMNANITTGK